MLNTMFFDPVKRSKNTREFDFAKYVDIHKNQTAPTSHQLVETLKDDFYGSHANISQEKLDKVWGFVGPKIEKNAGLAEFIKDNDGQKSNYFFPWLINIFRSPATALEMSYGAGADLDDVWHKDILDTDDPLVPFIKDDPAFVYNRERQLNVAVLASSIQESALACENKPLKIVDFGAGRLAWMRWHGYKPNPELATVYAFDMDPSIKPAELFADDLEALGVYYKHGDFTAQLNNPDCRGAALILLCGVASYISPATMTNEIVPAFYKLLDNGGMLFLDLQLDSPCYRHSMDILDWPTFSIPSKLSEVVDQFEKMRKTLWRDGIRFSAEYKPDTFNDVTSAVMATLQKVS